MKRRWILIGGAALLWVTPWLLVLRQPDWIDTSQQVWQRVPTPVTGDSISWSPDGEWLTFTVDALWKYVGYQKQGVQQAVFAETLPFDCAQPFWGRNPNQIYYFSRHNGSRSLFKLQSQVQELVLDSLGGPAMLGGGGISPDGNTLAVWKQEGTGNGAIQSVWISSPPGSAPRKYKPSSFEQLPRLRRVRIVFSPDGSRMLLLLVPQFGDSQLWLLPWPEGRPTRLQPSPTDADWLSDGHLLLAIEGRAWLTDTDAKRLIPLTTGPDRDLRIAASREHIDLLFPARRVAVVALPNELKNENAQAVAVSSTGDIAYSQKEGIWLQPPNAERRLLIRAESETSFEWPSFSPDGKRLSYTRLNGKKAQIWTVPTDSGPAQQFTSDELNARAASWSPDGQWLTFRTSRAGMIYVEKAPFTGTLAPTTLATADEAAAPLWSPDGEWIAILRQDGVWLISPNKEIKTKRLILPLEADAIDALAWSQDGKKLLAIVRAPQQAELREIDLGSGDAKLVKALPAARWRSPSGGLSFLALPKDGPALASRITEASELWQIDNFDLPHPWYRRIWR